MGSNRIVPFGYNHPAVGMYEFTEYSIEQTFNDVSAVYIFTDIEHNPLYIGETDELGTRIRNHEKLNCVNSLGCAFICIRQEGKVNRESIEKKLINYYKPHCNDQ
ncbi:MAG: GIY-YIG nuclease family protein [Rhodobacteraceae bacterium]|nr:GIY-YIG nuclease family protein [Paracoccaceae bacterium]